MLLTFSLLPSHSLAAQDTTQAYPWRLSYFPYPLASPNDGLMGVARAVWFRQSRWDDRVSVADQVAIDGGYSTKDAWLVRVRGDFPQLASGWRLQATAEAARLPHFLPGNLLGEEATREIAGFDLSRRIHGRFYLALRAEVAHIRMPIDTTVLALTTSNPFTETDARGRMALVYDGRDREYETRSGVLLQGGALAGSAANGYSGIYGGLSAWIPLARRARLVLRGYDRHLERTAAIDAARIVPAWENEFTLGGGPESNRALLEGEYPSRDAAVASAEARYDLNVFPGGAIGLLGFVDGTRTGDAPIRRDAWTVGIGGGVSLRLLRAAAFTVTAAHAEDHVRIYAYTGWAW